VTDIAQLEARLGELRGERDAAAAVMTREALVQAVDGWVAAARARADGAARLVVNGSAASGENLDRVLHEDLLGDDGLAGRVVGRLASMGFGALSNRQRDSQLRKLDEQIATATSELREAKRRAALEAVEAEFAA
jgi:hypothetical protein